MASAGSTTFPNRLQCISITTLNHFLPQLATPSSAAELRSLKPALSSQSAPERGHKSVANSRVIRTRAAQIKYRPTGLLSLSGEARKVEARGTEIRWPVPLSRCGPTPIVSRDNGQCPTTKAKHPKYWRKSYRSLSLRTFLQKRRL